MFSVCCHPEICYHGNVTKPLLLSISQLFSAPLNPVPIAEHFAGSQPQCKHSYWQDVLQRKNAIQAGYAISKQQKIQIKELYWKPYHLRGSSSTQAGKFPVITVMGSETDTVVKWGYMPNNHQIVGKKELNLGFKHSYLISNFALTLEGGKGGGHPDP